MMVKTLVNARNAISPWSFLRKSSSITNNSNTIQTIHCILYLLLNRNVVKCWAFYPQEFQRQRYKWPHSPIHQYPYCDEYLMNSKRTIQHSRFLNAGLDTEFPRQSPQFVGNATSLSNVSYSLVKNAIDGLYPPHELSQRNSKSRTDGYWKFIQKGEQPPLEFTYGEFDVDFFAELLDRAWIHYQNYDQHADRDNNAYNQEETIQSTTNTAWKDKVFCDIGSGTGRLVLAAAALHPLWKICKGLETLEGIHEMAVEIANRCKVGSVDGNSTISSHAVPVLENLPSTTAAAQPLSQPLPLAPMEFLHGSFSDPYQYLGDIDCAFVFSSCWKPDSLLQQLSVAIGRQFRPGSIIITTEYPLMLQGDVLPLEGDDSLPNGTYNIELLESIDGSCWVVGGTSTAYIHRVTKSLWKEYAGPRQRPSVPLEEQAFHLVQLMEKRQLTNTQAFLRNVANNMIFHGIFLEQLPVVVDDRDDSA